MKKLIIHSVPAAVSCIWLAVCCKTSNPIALTGPGFLKFYLILTVGFYISVFSLKYFDENVSKISFYFMFFIFALGMIKLIRGLNLDRPVGILFSILIAEILVIMVVKSTHLNHRIKK
ncbi:hypothetical protein [Chryseobacterium phocaeense]|uniref:hypothetical protein n=1 Tax=Chryseobacterium phocaeense TaxID=1816690 RepID=UPI0009BBB58D|nr:hypothetical protein [Chryseobacterium phocaeense]